MAHARTYDEQRHSPLEKINDGNLSGLGLAWYADLPTRRGIETTPLMVDGKLIVTGAWSRVYTYDARTGELLWEYDPKVPKAYAVHACCDVVNRGTAWDSFAYDPALNLLYIGVGNAASWNQKVRSPDGGDNLFVSSIVAVDADTGKYAWHYQTTPGDHWDYTAAQHMILADIEFSGQPRKVLMQAPKNGFFYLLDRATGELLLAEKFIPVTWATHVDMETGRPVEAPGCARRPRRSADRARTQRGPQLASHDLRVGWGAVHGRRFRLGRRDQPALRGDFGADEHDQHQPRTRIQTGG